MSKRALRYVCDECGASHTDKGQADECERWHADQRMYEACDKLRGEIRDELDTMSLAMLGEVLNLAKKLKAAVDARHT